MAKTTQYELFYIIKPDISEADVAKVTERFTRIAKDQLLYVFTVEDPLTFKQSWRGEIPMRTAAGPIYEYACHEGNYAMEGILAGAREAEKAGRPIEGARGEVREEGSN